MCSLDAFSFHPNNDLTFTARWSGDDRFGSGWYGGIESGIWETVNNYNPTSQYHAAWLWTDQTRLVISAAPVPAPSQAALALAGLLALALAGVRGQVTSMSLPCARKMSAMRDATGDR
jgi:hypothetical protein